jgi:mRNA-degrading endonuclease toxin of MazEF toxin-antitoxin module
MGEVVVKGAKTRVAKSEVIKQGDVWWLESEDQTGRPCLVLTRDRAIEVLNAILVAPVTQTIRRIATEISLDEFDGMPVACAATIDNVQVVSKSRLVRRVGALRAGRWPEVCAAMSAAIDC